MHLCLSYSSMWDCIKLDFGDARRKADLADVRSLIKFAAWFDLQAVRSASAWRKAQSAAATYLGARIKVVAVSGVLMSGVDLSALKLSESSQPSYPKT